MDNFADGDWIVSRKIVVKSLTRHFAPWKSRFFLLDRANAVLGVRSSATSGMILIPLSAPSLCIQRHEYGGEDKYLLTLKFADADNSTTKEIVMKFTSQEDLMHWETVQATSLMHANRLS
jgi:hypothetical protein